MLLIVHRIFRVQKRGVRHYADGNHRGYVEGYAENEPREHGSEHEFESARESLQNGVERFQEETRHYADERIVDHNRDDFQIEQLTK